MSQVKTFLVAAMAIAVLGVAGCSSEKEELQVSAQQEQKIAERIAPSGQLAMEGETGAAPVAAASAEPRSGQEIYDSKCATCHATGAASAPMQGNAGQWADRIAKGIDVLYTSAISGLNGMPPKGLCMDCSDDELKATVDYMVENSQ